MPDRTSTTVPEASVRASVLRALRATGGHWRRIGPTGWGEAWSLVVGDERYFVKLGRPEHPGMLDCEAEGLRTLAAVGPLRVPDVHAVGAADAIEFLVLEWIDLRRDVQPLAFGEALARLHEATPPRGPARQRFGWMRDNWIGGTPQRNAWSDDWCTFFREARLRPQFEHAVAAGFKPLARDAERLFATMPSLMRDYAPRPSFVHGDLWSGNVGSTPNGEPVVFDPAVHVADAEVDLAMTELFGGFGPEFLKAYERIRPLAPGYAQRRHLYNLYHLLNHLNLFGGAYLERVRRTVRTLVV